MERQVLVTGASSGFGLATAVRLASAGFTVSGLVPDDQEADRLTAATRDRHVAVEPVQADLEEPSSRRQAVEGRDLYGLVNNAGYLNAGLFQDVTIPEARRQIEAMVLAPMELARLVLPSMLWRGEGRIVNVTSAAAHAATPLSGWYGASKAALRELTHSLRMELAGTGVDAMEVEPGGFDTGIWDRAREELVQRRKGTARPEAYDKPLELIARHQHSMGSADAVAEAVLQALTTERHRPRYRVGPDAGPLRVASEIIPGRVWDRLVARFSGVA
jgi:short-subunit dehydrogenase